jgi:hypothetical protein
MSLYLRQFQHLLPRSRAWTLTIDKMLRRFFLGLGEGATAAARAVIDSVWAQLMPDTTDELVEWEFEHGLSGIGTDPERRTALAAAWQATGGQSPRYLQDTLQAAGFPVYYHGWRETGGTVRDPRSYTVQPLYGTVVCDSVTSTQPQCRGDDRRTTGQSQCNAFLTNDPKYIVNLPVDYGGPPPIPATESSWRRFVYFGGATFGTNATVPTHMLPELKRLARKLCPAHLWIVFLTEPPP